MNNRIKYRFDIKPNKLPKPITDAEFEIITELYFGKALHVRFSVQYPKYEIVEDYNSYHGKGYSYSECSCEGYDHSSNLWNRVFGELYCGGIARASYGQFHIKGFRHKKRLEQWIKNRGSGANYIRKPFQRLAQKYGLGENRMNLDSSVLIDSRADGVSGASLD